MREKYIEERFPRWFEFGRHVDGGIDLSDSYGDVITGICEETATRLVKAREAYVDALVEAFMADPDAFYRLTERTL